MVGTDYDICKQLNCPNIFVYTDVLSPEDKYILCKILDPICNSMKGQLNHCPILPNCPYREIQILLSKNKLLIKRDCNYNCKKDKIL